ncbi:hypothetical protein [Candidatus Mycoplasma haematominutum]|uniref:hypothetical protein n=1 Tax=Candidatus Mycoplasma haematominutum TaxID=209446 RepID=UPI0011B61DB9|nr:hypothetical protein [Candidatus Mycoplasma haematominutum]
MIYCICRGGGATTQLQELKLTSNLLQLNDTPTKNMNLTGKSKIEARKLNDIPTAEINFQKIDNVETAEPSQNVREVYSEVKRENTALNINSESATEVKTATQKISAAESAAYKSAVAKIQKYNAPSRRKRSVAQMKPQIEKLTVTEKQAIQKYYEQFLYLNQKRDPLQTQLKTIDSNTISETTISAQKDCEICPEVVDAIKKINWGGEELSLFNKSKKAWRQTDRPPQESQVVTTWGSQWNRSHPFNFFYKQENKFKEAVKNVVNTRKKYYDTVNSSSWRLCGLTIRWIGASCGYQTKGPMEQKIKDAHSEIELHIGSTLLQFMQQLGN